MAANNSDLGPIMLPINARKLVDRMDEVTSSLDFQSMTQPQLEKAKQNSALIERILNNANTSMNRLNVILSRMETQLPIMNARFNGTIEMAVERRKLERNIEATKDRLEDRSWFIKNGGEIWSRLKAGIGFAESRLQNERPDT
ncbi:MAG: hypothetical protein Q9227_004578 [Pyrenula ochraceoflavens]